MEEKATAVRIMARLKQFILRSWWKYCSVLEESAFKKKLSGLNIFKMFVK
jgi:hypothetical protein